MGLAGVDRRPLALGMAAPCGTERLGGFTGDIAGALLELLECAALLVFALSAPTI